MTFVLSSPGTHASTTVTMHLVGARPSAATTVALPVAGVTNYAIGGDRGQWKAGVQSFAELQYANIYDGVNVRYHGTQQQIEYDFIVSPGARASDIAIAFDGATHLDIDGRGNLIIGTELGDIVQHAPVLYQQANGGREEVDGRFVMKARGRVGIRVGRYDRRRPLIIDPVLTYSTYLGGTAADAALALAVDPQGNIYIAGETMSLNFPAPSGVQGQFGGGSLDAFVTKVNAAGNQIIYTTYLGGSDYEYAKDIAVDGNGNAYVTGTTVSPNFPTLGGLGLARRGYSDAFVTKLNDVGAIVYSTYLGGEAEDYANGIAVDAAGRAYVAGQTLSTDFPTVNALQPNLGGSPAWKTEDGGVSWTQLRSGLSAAAVLSLAIDSVDPAVVYAGTSHGVFKSTDHGVTWTAAFDVDVPVFTVAAAPSAVYAGTPYLLLRTRDGGATWDFRLDGSPVTALAIDPVAPQTVYAGSTYKFFKSTDGGDHWADINLGLVVWSLAVSRSSPSTVYAGTDHGVIKTTTGGGSGLGDWIWVNTGLPNGSVWSVAVDPTDSSIAYAATDGGLFKTTSGGSQWSPVLDVPLTAVAVAPTAPATIYLGGNGGGFVSHNAGAEWTAMAGLDGANVSTLAVDPTLASTLYVGVSGSAQDAFLTQISPDGSALGYSTYLGGRQFDYASDVAVDASGNAYLVGATSSLDFPVLNAARPTFGGVRDVFVAKITAAGSLAYATYLGGSAWEDGASVDVDGAGRAHVAGHTLSSDFPTVRAYQPTFGGSADAFVATLDATGTTIEYSTFLGGSGSEKGPASYIVGQDPIVSIAAMPSGEVFVAGVTGSHDFPVLRAIQPAYGGGAFDAFVAKFDADGLVQYATYLGGTGDDLGHRVALGSDGSTVVAGITNSTAFPTRNPLQSAKAGGDDAFVARIADDVPDGTPPSTSIGVSGVSGALGWYQSDVTITLTPSDPEGPGDVAFVDYQLNGQHYRRYSTPFGIATDGIWQISARATDNSGAIEAAPLPSAVVKIDRTAPSISIASPQDRDYLHSDTLALTFSARDDGSGVGAVSGALDDRIEASGNVVALASLSLGTHNFVVAASDILGNAGQESVTFRIIATIDSLIALVNAYSAQGLIDATNRKSLLAKLTDAKAALDRGNVSAARGGLRDFIDQCSAKIGKGMATTAANVLVADARYVLTTL